MFYQDIIDINIKISSMYATIFPMDENSTSLFEIFCNSYMLSFGTTNGVKTYTATAINPCHQCGDKKNDKKINKSSAKKKNKFMNVRAFGVIGHKDTKILLAIM